MLLSCFEWVLDLSIECSEKLENSLKQVKFVASQTVENFLTIAKQVQFFSGSFPVQTFKLSFIINFSEGSIQKEVPQPIKLLFTLL